MLQATILDCSFLDPFPFFQNRLPSLKIDIRRGKIVQALMQSLIVVIFHEGEDLIFQSALWIVIVQQDPVLHRLILALDLFLCLRMPGHAPDMFDFPIIQPLGQIG